MMVECNGLLFARDKENRISIYKVSEATSENYAKVKRYRRAVVTEAATTAFSPTT